MLWLILRDGFDLGCWHGSCALLLAWAQGDGALGMAMGFAIDGYGQVHGEGLGHEQVQGRGA